MRSPFNCARIKYEYNTNHNTVLVRCVIINLFGVISRIKKMDYWPEKKCLCTNVKQI